MYNRYNIQYNVSIGSDYLFNPQVNNDYNDNTCMDVILFLRINNTYNNGDDDDEDEGLEVSISATPS